MGSHLWRIEEIMNHLENTIYNEEQLKAGVKASLELKQEEKRDEEQLAIALQAYYDSKQSEGAKEKAHGAAENIKAGKTTGPPLIDETQVVVDSEEWQSTKYQVGQLQEVVGALRLTNKELIRRHIDECKKAIPDERLIEENALLKQKNQDLNARLWQCRGDPDKGDPKAHFII